MRADRPHVHLSGGVGIGGVLEPLQANPTIIEDNCFIGARSEIVEGVIVEAPLGHLDGGVHRPEHQIYDRATGEVTTDASPPARWSSRAACRPRDGTHSLVCAVIVKRVDAQTRANVGINDLLRLADNP